MKFRANPVIVDAFKIIGVIPITGASVPPGEYRIQLEDCPGNFICTHQMSARYIPTYGDYWVTQEDGYIYINPRDVFLRKYIRIDNVA